MTFSGKKPGKAAAHSEARIRSAERPLVREPFTLEQPEIASLMQETLLHYDTICNWMAGYGCHPGNAKRLERAMRKFGFVKRPVASRRRGAAA